MTPQGRGSGPTSASEATAGGTLPLRGAISEGGAGLLTTLLLLAVIDEFPRTAAIVLAPDIQRAFGLSDTAVLGMIGLVGVALVLTTLPAASLGDRLRRTASSAPARSSWPRAAPSSGSWATRSSWAWR